MNPSEKVFILSLKNWKQPCRPSGSVAVQILDDIARGTDKGIILATALVEHLRLVKVLQPNINTIERSCVIVIKRGTRRIYTLLTESLSDQQKEQLDSLLLLRDGTGSSTLFWIRQSPAANNIKHILEHIGVGSRNGS